MFEEFGLELPVLSRLVIAASNVVTGYWYLVIPAILLGLAIEFLVLRMAGHGNQLLAATLFTLVPLLLAGLMFLCMLLPLIDLVSSLRQ
jgi:type IV pilus assembly protein PilC